MARLTRATQKIFAGNATNNGVFGSLQAGSGQLSNDVETIQSLPAYEQGWNAATISSELLPPLEEFQGVQYANSYQLAYNYQEGIPEWDSGTTYYIGSVVKVITSTGYQIYHSLTDNNVGNQTSNQTNWELDFDSTTGYALRDLSNSTAIANCITKIPQDIKIETSDTVLTLKSGSKPYKADSSFFTVSSDVTLDIASVATEYLLVYSEDNTIEAVMPSLSFSQDTEPSYPTYLWYNTTTKEVKFKADNGNVTVCSLPIAIIYSDKTVTTFNGFGYIGSTIFSLPGVEGLIPNGRNADGSLNNTKFTMSGVSSRTYGNSETYVDANLIINSFQFSTDYLKYYNDKNLNINIIGNPSLVVNCGTASIVNGRITSFSSNNVFQAVDMSSNIDYIVGSGETNGVIWETWKSGKLTMKGYYSSSISANKGVTITFPKPFANTNYYVEALGWRTSYSDNAYPILYGANALQTTSMYMYNDGGADLELGFKWKVEGQGA